jgi:hypothetical protein
MSDLVWPQEGVWCALVCVSVGVLAGQIAVLLQVSACVICFAGLLVWGAVGTGEQA